MTDAGRAGPPACRACPDSPRSRSRTVPRACRYRRAASMNASARSSMICLRWRIVSVTTSSSASTSATSLCTRAFGMTPTVARPRPRAAASATAPIIETLPPPETSCQPRLPISVPTRARAPGMVVGGRRRAVDAHRERLRRQFSASPLILRSEQAASSTPCCDSVDDPHRLVDTVGDLQQVEVTFARSCRCAASVSRIQSSSPDQYSVPNSTIGNLVTLRGLHQSQRLEQLVERAEPAGQADERLRVLHEHRLAREEVAEVDAEVDPLVEAPARTAARCRGRWSSRPPRWRRGWPPPSRRGRRR